MKNLDRTQRRSSAPKLKIVSDQKPLSQMDDGAKNECQEVVLETYDASSLVGIRTLVSNAAIRRISSTGEETIELPKLNELLAAAAVARCLLPVRLSGRELKALRKILGLTLSEMAERLDQRTAVETVSRWESGSQPIGPYVEKVIRLVVCEELKDRTPGVSYVGKLIAEMKVEDWPEDKDGDLPYVRLILVKVKEQQSGKLIEAWDAKAAA